MTSFKTPINMSAIYRAHFGRECPSNQLTAWDTYPRQTGPERRVSDLKAFGPTFVASIERVRPDCYADRGTAAPVAKSQPPAVKKEAA